VLAVMEVSARTFPTNWDPVLKVAELPTCHTTLQAVAPFSSRTRLLEAVIRVEPAWKMNSALGLFWASRVKVPVSPRVGEV
jgi:hypothetical protein